MPQRLLPGSRQVPGGVPSVAVTVTRLERECDFLKKVSAIAATATFGDQEPSRIRYGDPRWISRNHSNYKVWRGSGRESRLTVNL